MTRRPTGLQQYYLTNCQIERPIAFASRTLTPTGKKYSQLDKERLAMVFAVTPAYWLCWSFHGKNVYVDSWCSLEEVRYPHNKLVQISVNDWKTTKDIRKLRTARNGSFGQWSRFCQSRIRRVYEELGIQGEKLGRKARRKARRKASKEKSYVHT